MRSAGSSATDKPFPPEQTIVFMVSNCVLTHIPPAIIEPELRALARMLKPGGAMYMMVNHEDHWAFHDGSANPFNYYRYSDNDTACCPIRSSNIRIVW